GISMIELFDSRSMIMLTLPMGFFPSTDEVMSMRILGGDKYHFSTVAFPSPLVTLTSAEKASGIWACAKIPTRTNSSPATKLIRVPHSMETLPFHLGRSVSLSHQTRADCARFLLSPRSRLAFAVNSN